MAKKLHSQGLKDIPIHKLITSGMMAQNYLENKITSGKVAYLGTLASSYYIEATGLEAIPVKDLDYDNLSDIVALALLDDEGFNWNEDISKALNLLRKKNIPVIVANTDTRYPVSKTEVAVAIGGVANMIEGIAKKRFLRFGKPDGQIFTYAYNLVNTQQDVKKNEILMVGDTLTTDIIGGNKFGLHTCLVLSGNTLPHRAEPVMRSRGVVPDWICESIAT